MKEKGGSLFPFSCYSFLYLIGGLGARFEKQKSFTSYLDETIDTMKKALHIENVKVITYVRPKTFKSNIYSGYPRNALAKSSSDKSDVL